MSTPPQAGATAAPQHDPVTLRAFFTTGHGLLALALLATELLAGMQQFLTATITPLLAAELGGQHLYGVVTAASQVAIFLTMPLGAGLMRRFSPAQLMTWLTPVTIIAGVLGALSPGMGFYIATRVLAGLAAGILATVGMGAIVTGLPPAWRQVVLAANNLMWLISAVVGPFYAAWVAHALSWRWALVLYLPLLWAARVVIARQLGRQQASEPERAALPWIDAVALAAGIGLVSCLSLGAWWAWALGAAGLALTAAAFVRLLPAGIIALRPGARSGIALLGVLSPMLFAADAIAPILGHDVLRFGALELGVLLTSMSFCWSLVGLWCGRRPVTGRAFARRGGVGIALMAAGLLVMGAAVGLRLGPALIGGFALAGTGMGLVFLDAMNAAFTPDAREPLEPTLAASSTVLAEQVPGAAAMTVSTSLVALHPTWGAPVLAALALLAVPAAFALRRASAAGTG